jgi:hypothetical protein
MTDEFTFEFSWDEKEEQDLSGLSQGSYPDWGLLRLRWHGKVTLFAQGETLTIPEITMPNGTPWSRNGMKKGGTTRLYIFTLEGENFQNGEPYTLVKLFDNQVRYTIEDLSKYPHLDLSEAQKQYFKENGKTRIDAWINLQKPAFQATLGKQLGAVNGAGLWVKAETTTYDIRENSQQLDGEGKPKKYYEKYWSGFTVYPNKAAMLAARKSEGNDNSTPHSPYPAKWTNDPVSTIDQWIEGAKMVLIQKKGNLLEAAKAAYLVNGDTEPAETANGSPVSMETIANVFGVTVKDLEKAGINKPF